MRPVEAKRIARKLELVLTPKHGSWLNVAETELSVLTRHCLEGRIPERSIVANEARAQNDERNARQVGVDWPFTTDDARVRLLRPKVKE